MKKGNLNNTSSLLNALMFWNYDTFKVIDV